MPSTLFPFVNLLDLCLWLHVPPTITTTTTTEAGGRRQPRASPRRLIPQLHAARGATSFPPRIPEQGIRVFVGGFTWWTGELKLCCYLQVLVQWPTRLVRSKIFFLTGVGLLLGWQSMWQLFMKKANIKGSVPFFLGLFLLFVRWPVAGIIMELYGSFVLFSGYGPPIQAFLYQIPIIGWILQYPFQLFGQLRRKRA